MSADQQRLRVHAEYEELINKGVRDLLELAMESSMAKCGPEASPWRVIAGFHQVVIQAAAEILRRSMGVVEKAVTAQDQAKKEADG